MSRPVERGRRAQPFTQVPQWVLFSGVSARAVQLYNLYYMHVNGERDDNMVWPSRSFLAWSMGLKRADHVDKYNRELLKVGAITIEKRTSPRGMHNITYVHETPPESYEGAQSLAAHYEVWKLVPEEERPGK